MGKSKGSKTASDQSAAKGEELKAVAEAMPGPAQEYPEGQGPAPVIQRDVRPSREEMYEEYDAHLEAQEAPDDVLGLEGVFAGESTEEPASESAPESEPEQEPQEVDETPGEFYLGTFRDREAAEKGFKDTKAAFTRATQENAWLKQQLQQAQVAMGNYQPAPQAQDDDLSPEELERLQYEDYPRFVEHFKKREDRLLQKAEQNIMGRLQASQMQQAEQRLERDMQDRIKTNYEALKDDVPLVEAEVIRLSREIQAGVHAMMTQGVTPEPELAERWHKVYQNPAAIVDWAAERIMERDARLRQAGEAEAKKTKTRLPANPVEPVGQDGAIAPAAPQIAGPPTESDYDQERGAFQRRAMAASTI